MMTKLFFYISLSVEKLERYLYGYDYEKFLQDEKTIDAVVRNVEVIGEEADDLTSDLCLKNPQIEWRKIIGTRNRIIHSYASVDLEIIRNSTQNDLTSLKTEVEKILENLK
jgi:hypothetical protein